MHSIRFTVILYSACRVPVRNVTSGLLYVNSFAAEHLHKRLSLHFPGSCAQVDVFRFWKNSKGSSNTIRFGGVLILDMHCFKSMAKIQKKTQWFCMCVCFQRKPCETSESKPCISKAKNGCSISSLSKIFHTCSKARSRRQRLPESCHKKKGPPAILPVPVVSYGTELKNLMIQFAQFNTMDDL